MTDTAMDATGAPTCNGKNSTGENIVFEVASIQ